MNKNKNSGLIGAIVIILFLLWKFPTFLAVLSLAFSLSYIVKLLKIQKEKKENLDKNISYKTYISNARKDLLFDIRKVVIISIMIFAVSASLAIKNSNKNKVETTKDPEIQWAERMNGSNTEVIAKMTYIIVPEKEVTEDYIKDWFKEVQELDSDYDIIIYEETKNENPSKGVYAISNMILKDIELTKEDDGSYSYSGGEDEKQIDIPK